MSDEEVMRLAIAEAERALEHDDVPIGAVVVRDGEVIGTGRNERFQLSPERYALIARDAQHPHQVPHSRGMMDMLANLGQ